MRATKDLTRWNRAGLKRFRYVDGNAATYLETLRKELCRRFSQWKALEVDIPANESKEQRQQRLLDQYYKNTGDLGWEIQRSYARACHVLTEHIDAYANEAFLGTATQWDNVRRLVDMIGHSPAPPASASTNLVLLAKRDQSGKVKQGFQVSYIPPDGGAPVIFETLEDIEVDYNLNRLRLRGWNPSSEPFLPVPGTSYWIAKKEYKVSIGQRALVLNTAGNQTQAVRIDDVGSQGELLLKTEGSAGSVTWIKGRTQLLVNPKNVYNPHLNGSDVIELGEGHGLAADKVVAWKHGAVWQFRTVAEADDISVRLIGSLPPQGKYLYGAYAIKADRKGVVWMPAEKDIMIASTSRSCQALWEIDKANVEHMKTDAATTAAYGYESEYLKIKRSAGITEVYVVGAEAEPIGQAKLATAAQGLIFSGSPGDLTIGDWFVGENRKGKRFGLKLKTILEQENSFRLTFEPSQTQVECLYGPFQHILYPVGNDGKSDLLPSEKLVVELKDGQGLPTALKVGKTVVLEQDGSDNGVAHKTSVKSIDQNSGTITLNTMPDSSKGFTIGNTVIYGNVVTAGHGETRPAKVLGSGDATRSNQSFLLKVKNTAFVADSSQSSGVAAAITLTVAGQIWKQVGSLDDSKTTDPHYEVRVTEDGYLNIIFGDGIHGRRLPTGSNNIRVAYREGTGLCGNVDAGSLVKAVKPHNLIDKVRQPIKAGGGNDLEGMESLRTNAPAVLFTLQRAVSLNDFARMAEGHSSVWQARASRLSPGPGIEEYIEVVVVPAGGGVLESLKYTLEKHLKAHAVPGVLIKVEDYVKVPLDLCIMVQVNPSQYVPETVVEAVRDALVEAFSLKKRKLGQTVYRSEVYEVVEAVKGVENSECRIMADVLVSVSQSAQEITGRGGTVQAIRACDRQVIYIVKDKSNIIVEYSEYSL